MGLGISNHTSSVKSRRACAVEAHCTLSELERANGDGAAWQSKSCDQPRESGETVTRRAVLSSQGKYACEPTARQPSVRSCSLMGDDLAWGRELIHVAGDGRTRGNARPVEVLKRWTAD
jgi:hypothetical protein